MSKQPRKLRNKGGEVAFYTGLGGVLDLAFVVKDENGDTVNVTGFTIKMTYFDKAESGTAIFSTQTATLDSATVGEISFDMKAVTIASRVNDGILTLYKEVTNGGTQIRILDQFIVDTLPSATS